MSLSTGKTTILILIIPKNRAQKAVIKGSRNEKKWMPGFLSIRRKINNRLTKLAMGITSLIIVGSFIMENSDVPLFSVVSLKSITIFSPIRNKLITIKSNKYITGRTIDCFMLKESLTLIYYDYK